MQEAVVFQIAALLALLGMGLAWRGVMTQYAGFYDLSLAWSHVLWGFVSAPWWLPSNFRRCSSRTTRWLSAVHRPPRGRTCSSCCGLSRCIRRCAPHSATSQGPRGERTNDLRLGPRCSDGRHAGLVPERTTAQRRRDLRRCASVAWSRRLRAVVSASRRHLDRLARPFDAARATCRCCRSGSSVAHGALSLAYYAFFQPLIWLAAPCSCCPWNPA